MFHGEKVCMKFYRFVNRMQSDKRWRNLKQRWQEHHVKLVPHGNAGRIGNKALTMTRRDTVLTFIDSYADKNATVSEAYSFSISQIFIVS